MRCRLRLAASRSTTSAGVSMASKPWPIRARRRGATGSTEAFIEALVFQMGGVGPADQRQAAVGRPQQAVDRGVADLPAARVLQAQAGGQAIQHVEHTAMREQ